MAENKKKKVTGIGGISFKCKDPDTLKAWYHRNLGLVTNEYGKFVHIMDPEGHKIELWEPVDQPFTDEYKGNTTHCVICNHAAKSCNNVKQKAGCFKAIGNGVGGHIAENKKISANIYKYPYLSVFMDFLLISQFISRMYTGGPDCMYAYGH